MKKLAFTICFGSQKYKNMARGLKKSIEKYSPSVEFKILDERHFTPYEKGLSNEKKLYPKDFKYPKIEILSKLNDKDTTYMFIDSDAFVFGDISSYFDFIEDDQVLIEYIYNKDGTWAGVKNLNFVDAAYNAGIKGLKPFSINSGFIIWKGKQKSFSIALDLIKTKLINDYKGLSGDEYYLCSGLQLGKANIKPIDYSILKLGKFWKGKIGYKNGKLISSYYKNDDRIIQHYGNSNYYNTSVRKVLNDFEIKLEDDLQTKCKVLKNYIKNQLYFLKQFKYFSINFYKFFLK